MEKKTKAGFILPMLAFMQSVFNAQSSNTIRPMSRATVNHLRAGAVMNARRISYYTHFYESLPLKRVNGKWRVKK